MSPTPEQVAPLRDNHPIDPVSPTLLVGTYLHTNTHTCERVHTHTHTRARAHTRANPNPSPNPNLP